MATHASSSNRNVISAHGEVGGDNIGKFLSKISEHLEVFFVFF
jgi:hypothetical protein